MTSSILTRSAVMKDLERKLKLTLDELQSVKNLNNNFLKERDDVEEEIEAVNNNNFKLKRELAELHCLYLDVVSQRDKLQVEVSSFQQCSDTHDLALNHICELKTSLHEARKSISVLEESKNLSELNATQNLFQQLVVGENSKLSSEYVSDKCCTCNNRTIEFSTHRKLKKYLKAKRMIAKNCIKRQKLTLQCNKYRRERYHFISSINSLEEQLIESRYLYDRDTQALQLNLLNLEKDYIAMRRMYEDCQQLLRNQEIQLDTIHSLANYNENRLQSLTNKFECADSATTHTDCLLPLRDSDVYTQEESYSVGTKQPHTLTHSNMTKDCRKVYIFSDGIGIGLGSLMTNHTDQTIVNICTPGSKLSNLIHMLETTSIDKQSTIIIFYGDSFSVTRKDIINLTEVMMLLQTRLGCKFIIGAFPYSYMMTERQKSEVHNLNMIIYNTTHCHDDILFIDTNMFISRFYLTRDTCYLPNYYKTQLAKILAYSSTFKDTGTRRVTTIRISSLGTGCNQATSNSLNC